MIKLPKNADKQKYFDLFIFDFDGTIADSRLNIFNSFNHAIKLYDLPKITKEKFYPTIGKFSINETFTFFYPDLSLDKIETLVKKYRENLLKNSKKEITLYPKVKETLNKINSKNKKAAILTTKNVEIMRKILKDLELIKYSKN